MAAAHKNRKNRRAQVQLIARYRSPTAFDFVAEECHDLSVGGMFIRSPAPAPAGTLLKLECDVDRDLGAIRAVARVVWLREHDMQGEPAGMGVKFVKIEAGGQELIQRLVESAGGGEGAGPEARGSMPSPVAAAAVPTDDPPRSASVEPARDEHASASPEPQTTKDAQANDAPASDASAAPAVSPQATVIAASAPEPARVGEATREPVAVAARSMPAPARAAEVNRGPVLLGAALLVGVVVIALAGRKPRAPEPAASAPHTTAAKHDVQPVTPAAATKLTAPRVEPATAGPYVLQLTTIPEGARITIGERALVSPALVELGELDAPVEIHAEKPGFEALTATIDLDRFSARDGERVATVTLALPPLPRAAADEVRAEPEATPPAKAPAPHEVRRAREQSKPPVVAEAKPAPTPAALATGTPSPAPAAAPVAVAAAAPSPTPAPAPVAAPVLKETPMQAAMACLARGDNGCVIDALEGKARSAAELEMLIETYRALGKSEASERHMRSYVQKFPSERRSVGYRRLLERDTQTAETAETIAQ